jgi:dephospho-CoA kinase
VRHAQRRFLARCCAAGRRLVVLDVPLLYETGGERLVDAVAVVSARAIVQAQRVLRRPGMSTERLAAILRRQLPDAEKRRRADFVIRTDLDLRRAKTQVAHVIDAARARPAHAWPRRWPLVGDRNRRSR